MSPLEQLVESFAEIVEAVPVEDAIASAQTFLNASLATRFQDQDLGEFCRFLLDNLRHETPIAGLAIALREMTDHLSLQFGQFLPAEKIQETLVKFNLLRVDPDGRLQTVDGSTDATIFFGNSSYLLVGGYLLTEIEGRKFQQFQIDRVTQDLLVTGIFQFKEGPLAVIDSKIQTHFGELSVDTFHGEIINSLCYGVASSNGKSYLICDSQVIDRIDLNVTDCLALALTPEGLIRAIIEVTNPKTRTSKAYFIENNQLQERCGDVNIETLTNLQIDHQGNLTGFVTNPNLPKERIARRVNPAGELNNETVPNLLPFTNGILFDEVNEKLIEYLIEADFYQGKVYGKFMISGKERVVLNEQLVSKVEGFRVVDFILEDDFTLRGNGIIVLEDDTWVQLDKGKLIRAVGGQEVFDYRQITTFNHYPEPTGFFFDGVSWFLALNGNIIACPIKDENKTYSFNVEGCDFIAETGSNGRLNYAGLVDATDATTLMPAGTKEVLIINGEELAPQEFAGEIRRFTKYSNISFNSLGHVFCELEAEDGVIAYYANGKILNPKDYFLLPELCIAKQEIIDYLRDNTDFFEKSGDVEILEISNYRLSEDNQRFFSFKYQDKTAILLGSSVITETATIKDLVLDTSEPESLHLGFTSKGTVQSYGYGSLPAVQDFEGLL